MKATSLMFKLLDDGCLWDTRGERLVMPLWELPLWEKVVSDLIPAGDVFEVGLGLGVSGKLISEKAKSHIIAEKDSDVMSLSDKKDLVTKTVLGDGLSVLSQQPDDSLDCILVDDYSIDHPVTLTVLPEFWKQAALKLRAKGRVVAPFSEPGIVSSKRFTFKEFGRIQIDAKCSHGQDLNLPLGYWEKTS